MKNLLVILIVLLFAQTGFGQETVSEYHPIDLKHEKCLRMDSNQTTLGAVECTLIALEEWKLEMNKYYNLLMDTLDSEAKSELKKSNEKWHLFKESEINLIIKMYGKKEGTIWQIVIAEEKKHVMQQRAIRLMEYYNNLMNLE